MCSENSVFKEIERVLVVDRLVLGSVAWREAAERLWEHSTV